LHGDATLSLNALADQLESHSNIDPQLREDAQTAKLSAMALMDHDLGPYQQLKNEVCRVFSEDVLWVRDITLSNSMWGNRMPFFKRPTQGVHALGGGIGQGLSMSIGAELANQTHHLKSHTLALMGDGGFMLNVGELACAVQEKANVVMLVMNDGGYGVIKNIQDDLYGSRHGYVDLVTPRFESLCASLGVHYLSMKDPSSCAQVLQEARVLQQKEQGPVLIEVDMKTWGPFNTKFAGPPLKKAH
jgi:acetolactate synthase-1/2/3 large subunit